jgi:hypothetical protein
MAPPLAPRRSEEVGWGGGGTELRAYTNSHIIVSQNQIFCWPHAGRRPRRPPAPLWLSGSGLGPLAREFFFGGGPKIEPVADSNKY